MAEKQTSRCRSAPMNSGMYNPNVELRAKSTTIKRKNRYNSELAAMLEHACGVFLVCYNPKCYK